MTRAKARRNPAEPPDDDLPGGSAYFSSAKQYREWRELVEWATNALRRRKPMATKFKIKTGIKRPEQNGAVVRAKAPRKPITEEDSADVAEPVSQPKKKKKLKPKAQSDDEDDGPMVMVGNKKRRLSEHASASMIGLLDEMGRKFNDEHIAGAGVERAMCTGIPMPFALEWLLQSTVLPLGRVIQIVGKTGSNKSSLAIEFVRLIRAWEGVGYLFENESKFNAELCLSILGYPEHSLDEVLGHVRCKDLNDWQKKLQALTDALVKRMTVKSKTNKKPLGCIYPVGMIVDSVMGKLSEESTKNIESKGFAGRKHPDEAMSITYFLKSFADKIADYPFILMLVNHLKIKKIEGTSATERIKGGGELISFQESIELECKKIGDIRHINPDKTAAVDAGGNRLSVKCAKNSFGQTNRELEVDFKWEDKILESGEVRQVSHWDWAGAFVDILLKYQTVRKGVVRNVVDVTPIGERNRVYSKRMGVKEKEPISKSAMGRLITGNKEIRRDLRRLFGIKRYTAFKPGMDFYKLQQDLKAKYQERADSE